ncbi:MAG: type II secretion system protein GspL [Pseudomonadota bacterium]
MAENFYLAVGNDQLEWLVLDETSGIVRFRGTGDWDDLAALTGEMRWSGATRVLLPVERVLLTAAQVPSRQQRQVLQAIPYMVEEELATDVEDCHFAVGPRNETGATSVAVVDDTFFETLLGQLSDAGLSPDSLTLDVLHLPRTAGSAVLLDGDRALLRTGDQAGLAVEVASLPLVIALLADAERDLVTVTAGTDALEAFQLYASQIEAELPGVLTLSELEYAPFEYLCRSFDAGAINLLQGKYRVQEENTGRGRVWQSVAMLAGFAFALHVMLLIGQGIYLDVKAAQYEREAMALYAEVFPGNPVPRDLRRRWEARLRAGTGQSSGEFFDLFSEAARYIPGSSLRLENVNFNESRGDLNLQLVAPGSDAFVQYSQTLTGAGLQAEVGTISQDADRARGSVRIKTTGGI